MFNRNTKAFTLIELLVVISIIGLLSSIVLVSTKGVREKARLAKAQKFDSSIQHALGANAVGVWRFEEVSGSPLKTHDESGYGNDGELKGGMDATNLVSADDLYPNTHAMSFNGTSDCVNVPHHSSLDITDAITISMWVKLNVIAPANNPAFIAKNHSTSWDCYLVSGSVGVIGFFINNANRASTPANSVVLNTWHHIVWTYDKDLGANNIKIYVDGSQSVSADYTTAIGTDTDDVSIGDYGGQSISGLIDDVRIYDTALSAMEIQQHYAEGARKYNIAME